MHGICNIHTIDNKFSFFIDFNQLCNVYDKGNLSITYFKCEVIKTSFSKFSWILFSKNIKHPSKHENHKLYTLTL